jgi:lipoprotein-releasing system ATP-binding protein
MAECILSAKDLIKSYFQKGQDTPVLKGLSLSIAKGEFVALVGHSGVGKSTFLHLLGCLDVPDSGDIILNIDGKSYNYKKLSSNEGSRIRNNFLGFVFQFHHLLPEFTALENVMMPALIAGVSSNEAKKKAIELLQIVGVEHRASHKPAELSGGEQQRIAISRALINNPKIVLADEPTGNLDSNNSDAILNLIMELRKKYKLTFIVATHSNEIASISERKLVMRDGKIVEEVIQTTN